MRKLYKPVLCLVLWGILLVSFAHIAFGAEDDPSLCFRTEKGPFCQFPLSLELGREGGFSTWCDAQLQSVKDTSRNDTLVPAYSLYPGETPVPDTACRRVDLEDGNMDAALARRLRAVVQASYPAKDVHSVQIAANTWLRENSLPGILELQAGEAVLAAQAAVWTLTSGEEDAYIKTLEGSGKNPDTEQNVRSLYAYLLSRPEEAARYDTVSGWSLTEGSAIYRQDEDGVKTVTVSVRVDTTVSRQDLLTVSALWGGKAQSQLVTGAGEYSFTFRGTETAGEVLTALSGQQYGSDVYLLLGRQPEGPALITCHSGMYPVYTETPIPLTPEETHPPAEPAEAS